MTHVKNNSGNNEWYSPPQYVELARQVMGSIDCDPASNSVAQQVVKAGVYYSVDNSGLDKQWFGNVWMNPPYSSKLITAFIDCLLSNVFAGNTKQFCVLVNNATETKWFQKLALHADAVLFISKRVKFLDSELNPKNTPLQGQVILYYGDNINQFIIEGSKIGVVFQK